MAVSEVEAFREFFQSRGISPVTVRVDVAWVAQQTPGTATLIMNAMKTCEEWRDVRREREPE